MKIQVKTIEVDNSRIVITGNTNLGELKGIWKSDDFPVIGMFYFVELNIAELHNNQIISVRDEVGCLKVCINGDNVLFAGVCEAIDDVYYIRFTDDWLEIDSKNIQIGKGDYILFRQRYDQILIYSYD